MAPEDRLEVHLRGPAASSNARILVHRTAFPDVEDPQQRRLGARPVLEWADTHNLGQTRKLVSDVAARRTAALQDLADQGYGVHRLTVRPLTRLAIGHGDHANPYEMGLSLHGTYGWPCLPGSSLKGLADAQARSGTGDHDDGSDEGDNDGGGSDGGGGGGGGGSDGGQPVSVQDRSAVFGAPRPRQSQPVEPGPPPPHAPAERGQVQFLDALPAASPVEVTRDVLTPHVQPYYTWIAERSGPAVPPAEHHHPVPVEFLTVSAGEFAVDLVGDETAVMMAAEWLTQAVAELGLGAKTSAGYGYAEASDRAPNADSPAGDGTGGRR